MSSVAVISVEVKIKRAINELKHIIPPARRNLFKLCEETHGIKVTGF